MFQAGDHAQRGGFAAAGRAEQGHEAALFDIQRHLLDRGDRAELLDDIVEGYR